MSGPNVAEPPERADHQALRDGELPEVRRKACDPRSPGSADIAPNMMGTMTPKRSATRPIKTPPKAKPTIAQRIRQRRVAPRHVELGLQRLGDHRDRPHADAPDGAQQNGSGKANPSVAAFDVGCGCGLACTRALALNAQGWLLLSASLALCQSAPPPGLPAPIRRSPVATLVPGCGPSRPRRGRSSMPKAPSQMCGS